MPRIEFVCDSNEPASASARCQESPLRNGRNSLHRFALILFAFTCCLSAWLPASWHTNRQWKAGLPGVGEVAAEATVEQLAEKLAASVGSRTNQRQQGITGAAAGDGSGEAQVALVSVAGALAFWRAGSASEAGGCSAARAPAQPDAEIVAVESSTVRLNLAVLVSGTRAQPPQQQVARKVLVEWALNGRPIRPLSGPQTGDVRLRQVIIEETDQQPEQHFYGAARASANRSGLGRAGAGETHLVAERQQFFLAPYVQERHLERLLSEPGGGQLPGSLVLQARLGGARQPLRDSLVSDGRSIDWQRLEAHLRDADARAHCSARSGDAAAVDARLLVVQAELARVARHERGLYSVRLCASGACQELAFHLQVLEDVPLLMSSSQQQLLEPGERLSLRCQATGFTLPQITWFLDGQQLSERGAQPAGQQALDGDPNSGGAGAGDEAGALVRAASSARLRIGDYVSLDGTVHSFVNASRVQVTDGGNYKCQASNGLHSVERATRVDVRGPPTIARQLANVSFLSGQAQVSLQCPYSGSPISLVEWFHLAQDDEAPASSAEQNLLRARRQQSRGPPIRALAAADPGEPPSDPSNDDWLAQASDLTPPSAPDEYPEPVPDVDYALPGADYADLEMDLQQQSRWRRRKRQAPSAGEWVKLPQSRRQQVHPNGTLLIQELARSDAGLYKCRALGFPVSGAADEHQHQHQHQHQPLSPSQHQSQPLVQEASSNAFQLSVLVAPVISPFSSPESLREGMRNFLTCSVLEGDAPLHLDWLKEGRPIEEYMGAWSASGGQQPEPGQAQPRIRVETNNEFTSTLYFSHVEFKDNGNYTCMATNKAASVNYTARMLVNVPPKWIKAPKDLECVAGQSIVIDCQAEAYPNARVWWEVGLPAPSLEAAAASRDRSAPAGLLAHQHQLSQQALQQLQAAQHQQVQALLKQAPNHYRTIISNSRVHILENASLVIKDVQRQDQGFYLCQAANNFGTLSALIRLTVNVGASFANKYLLKYARINERVELDCEPRGQAQIYVIWYMRHHSLATGNQLSNLTANTNPQLQQQQQQLFAAPGQLPNGNAGESRLSDGLEPAGAALGVAHGLGRRLVEASVRGEPVAPAPSQQQQQQQQARSSGGPEAARQRGTSLSEPSIGYEILARQEPLSGAPGGELVRLVINQARRFHSADYICRASNQFGADERLVRLLVQEPPEPVEELSLVQAGPRSLTVAWRAPYSGNLPIGQYTLEWAASQAAGEPSWSQLQLAGPQSPQQASIGGLQPRSAYLVRVRAHNQLGQSAAPRIPLLALTAEEAPGSPPADLRALPVSSSALQLSWLASGGPETSVKGFYVGYRLANSSDPFVFKALPAAEALLQGPPPPSPPASEAGVSGHAAPARHANLSAAGAWGPPRRLGVLLGDLRRNSRYSLIVQAFNSAGPGPQSDPVEGRTLSSDPPGAPQLRALAASYTSLELVWSFQVAAPVDGYQLYLRPSDESSSGAAADWQERRFSAAEAVALGAGQPPALVQRAAAAAANASELGPAASQEGAPPASNSTGPFRYLVERLACGRAYQLYLVGHSSVGQGQASQIVRAKTRGSTPISPRAADYISANLSWATINLDAWLDGGCSLLGFEIRYRRLVHAAHAAARQQAAPRLAGEPSSLRSSSSSGSGSGSGSGSNGDWVQLAAGPSRLATGERRAIELKDLEPESWYLVETVAESEAGKTAASHSFMTLDRLGQVPAEALYESGQVLNGLPALFRDGPAGSGPPFKSSLVLQAMSPGLLALCLGLLLLLAGCSLFVARKYSRRAHEAASSSSSSSAGQPHGRCGNGHQHQQQALHYQQVAGAGQVHHYRTAGLQHSDPRDYAPMKGSAPCKTATSVMAGSLANSGLAQCGSSPFSSAGESAYVGGPRAPTGAADSLDLSQFMMSPGLGPHAPLQLTQAEAHLMHQQKEYCDQSQQRLACESSLSALKLSPQHRAENRFQPALAGSGPTELGGPADSDSAQRFKTLPHKQAALFQQTHLCPKGLRQLRMPGSAGTFNRGAALSQLPQQEQLFQQEQEEAAAAAESDQQQMYSKLRLIYGSQSSYDLCPEAGLIEQMIAQQSGLMNGCEEQVQQPYSPSHNLVAVPPDTFNLASFLAQQQQQQQQNSKLLHCATLLRRNQCNGICNGQQQTDDSANKLSSQVLLDCQQQQQATEQQLNQCSPNQLVQKYQTANGCETSSIASTSANSSLPATSSVSSGDNQEQLLVNLNNSLAGVQCKNAANAKMANQTACQVPNGQQNGTVANEQIGEYALPFLPKWV